MAERHVPPASWPTVARVSRPALICATILTLALPAAPRAQSIQAIAPQQCVWRAGDNPAWAAPGFDDSTWQPYSTWNPASLEPRIWIRCHADLSSIQHVSHPALQVALYAAYEAYGNGRLIGSAGSVKTGNFTLNTIREWPLNGDLAPPAVIALHITRRVVSRVPVERGPQLALFAGSANLLQDRRSAVIVSQVAPRIFPAVCFCITSMRLARVAESGGVPCCIGGIWARYTCPIESTDAFCASVRVMPRHGAKKALGTGTALGGASRRSNSRHRLRKLPCSGEPGSTHSAENWRRRSHTGCAR